MNHGSLHRVWKVGRGARRPEVVYRRYRNRKLALRLYRYILQFQALSFWEPYNVHHYTPCFATPHHLHSPRELYNDNRTKVIIFHYYTRARGYNDNMIAYVYLTSPSDAAQLLSRMIIPPTFTYNAITGGCVDSTVLHNPPL